MFLPFLPLQGNFCCFHSPQEYITCDSGRHIEERKPKKDHLQVAADLSTYGRRACQQEPDLISQHPHLPQATGCRPWL